MDTFMLLCLIDIFKGFGYFGQLQSQSYITDRWIIEDVPDGH